MNWRLARAVLAAACVLPAILVLMKFVQYFSSNSRPSGREFSRDPFLFLVVAIIVILPMALVWSLVVVVPFTRSCVRRGYADLTFMTICGGIAGTVISLMTVLVASPVLDWRSTMFYSAVAAIAGAGTSAVYWLVLDPPSYYRQP